jgi:indole-3-glycerol phosphate synthase
VPADLAQLVQEARQRMSRLRSQQQIAELGRRATHHLPRGFANALREQAQSGPAIIAELKKASPSRGQIRGSFHPSVLALELAEAGATALSVLTEEDHFHGSLANLSEASVSVDLPCLRKDFVVHEYQVLEARAYSADAVLLIVAALSDAELRHLKNAAQRYALDVLCEVHDRDELKRALDIGFDVIGVNNRDLRTMEVKLETAESLAPEIPSGVVKVAESGIHTGADLRRLRDAGYDAFLIGESLMKHEHPGEALKQLLAGAVATKAIAGVNPNA